MPLRGPASPPIFSEAVQLLCPKCGSEEIARVARGSTVWCCDDCGFGFAGVEIVVGVRTFVSQL